jgi:hypothetical protein
MLTAINMRRVIKQIFLVIFLKQIVICGYLLQAY